MKLLIGGCGYLGTALGEALARGGAAVWGLRRDWSRARPNQPSFKPIQADLNTIDSLEKLPDVDFAVLCQAPSRESDNYKKTYIEGTNNLLKILQAKKPVKIVMVSSTSVYGTSDGSWVDESTDPLATPHSYPEAYENAKILLETEKLVLRCGNPSNVIRFGGMYGPGRNRIAAIKTRHFKPAFSEDYTNRIHIEDAVSAIRLLLEKGRPGEVYLGVDDYPCTQKEFYDWLYKQLLIPVATSGHDKMRPHGSNKRCANKKIKALGMRFKYPTFREGYESLIAVEA